LSHLRGESCLLNHFRLDTAECRLVRGGADVPLTPKAFDTLVALVRRGGQLVDKDELMKEVWPDSALATYGQTEKSGHHGPAAPSNEGRRRPISSGIHTDKLRQAVTSQLPEIVMGGYGSAPASLVVRHASRQVVRPQQSQTRRPLIASTRGKTTVDIMST